MSISVEVSNIKNNPHCLHGPTILFSRSSVERKFYACSACRDRKDCNFFVYKDESNKITESKKQILQEQKKSQNINHVKLYITLNQIKDLSPNNRVYCVTCDAFQLPKFKEKHNEHKLKENISDHDLLRPSELLEPLDNAKKEAQYFFTKISVETIVNMLSERNIRNVICVGAPRIHEFIVNERTEMNSILLDIDERYHNFYGPLQFCQFNCFNNHFFLPESKEVFIDFLQTDNGNNFVLITDPPFGGRVELLSETFKQINETFLQLNKRKTNLEIMWMFPYFMEPQIINTLPNFHMLDYKVDYDNHSLFRDGPKGRKYGSPVRIFTNIDPSTVKLPIDQGYKYCEICKRWVAVENNHCRKCKTCPSKDGRTYVHCKTCNRCVKPSWKHCKSCNRCAQVDHKCGPLVFEQECFHCREKGHKKRNCPKVNHEELTRKRKCNIKTKNSKKIKK